MTTTTTLNVEEAAKFWRVARRLYAVYSELDRTFELGVAPCADLDDPVDRAEAEVMDRVRRWFEELDTRVQVWQLRQLLQSTTLQSEENLRYLIARHLDRKQKSEADKEKIDFLLVQYFAHCAPHGLAETGLAEVARVLEPAIGKSAKTFPDWAPGLDEKLSKLNQSNSLEQLQNSGALQDVRELKQAVGDQYFEPGFLVAFTRFNFLARRAFFHAMHQDLHAIRNLVNDLEKAGITVVDCRDAGLSDNESLDQVRHVVHQWKTPFRAPYSGGSSFLQLIVLRHALQLALESSRKSPVGPPGAAVISFPRPAEAPAPVVAKVTTMPAPKPALAAEAPKPVAASPPEITAVKVQQPPAGVKPPAASDLMSQPPQSADHGAPPSPKEQAEEDDYLMRCVVDIAEQLKNIPQKNSPAVSAIVLGGCKLLIATWEAQAFALEDETARALQRTVAARTILHVCMERHKKNEPTDIAAAVDIARVQVEEMKGHVDAAKEAKNIDAAVNLAATTKRLLSLMTEAEKLG